MCEDPSRNVTHNADNRAFSQLLDGGGGATGAGAGAVATFLTTETDFKGEGESETEFRIFPPRLEFWLRTRECAKIGPFFAKRNPQCGQSSVFPAFADGGGGATGALDHFGILECFSQTGFPGAFFSVQDHLLPAPLHIQSGFSAFRNKRDCHFFFFGNSALFSFEFGVPFFLNERELFCTPTFRTKNSGSPVFVGRRR